MNRKVVYSLMIFLVFTIGMKFGYAKEPKFINHVKNNPVLVATAVAGGFIVAKITSSVIKLGFIGLGAYGVNSIARHHYEKNSCDNVGSFALDDLLIDMIEIARSAEDRALFVDWLKTEDEGGLLELSSQAWDDLVNDKEKFIEWYKINLKEKFGDKINYEKLQDNYEKALDKLHALLNKVIEK